MPSLVDFFGIIVILFVVFGASLMPNVGAALGRRLASRRAHRRE